MTIELAMWFALGFLAAGVLALLAMGALWRRAVRLTSARIAARQPADVDEAVAARDLAAAAHAREARRFELALAETRHAHAEARIAIGRQGAAIVRLEDARDAEAAARAAGEAREAALTATLDARDAALEAAAEAAAAAAARIGELEQMVADLQASVMAVTAEHAETVARLAEEHAEALERLEDEHAARIAEIEGERDTARVDGAARRAAGEALEAQLVAARHQIAVLNGRFEAEVAAHGLTATTAQQERDRADRLDRRIERLVADVADREEIADRRQRELERAREALTLANSRIASLGRAAEGAPAPGDNVLRSLAQLEARNRELEARLAAAAKPSAPANGGDAGTGDAASRAALRDHLAEMAAEMVRLTATVEGAGSSIDRIVAAPETAGAVKPSLADRIRALRTTPATRSGPV